MEPKRSQRKSLHGIVMNALPMSERLLSGGFGINNIKNKFLGGRVNTVHCEEIVPGPH